METTNNDNLNLFIQLARGINNFDLKELLIKSWEYDKLKTMAIIFNSRDRLKGKKEKTISNNCLIWLRDNYPLIYKKNIMTYIDKYGCWNDLNYIIKKTNNNKFEYKLFASQLKKDKELLEENKNISLCSKWVINANNKNTIKIARYLFEDIKNYHEKYRKEYLIPLRKRLDLIETKLCSKNYEAIDYSKLPSKALSIYKKTFIKYDNNKYSAFLNDISNNKIKLKVNGILPHEIIYKYMKNLNDIDETLELEWKAIIDNHNDNHNDNNNDNDNNDDNTNDDNDIIPIVDVSGSMYAKFNNIEPIYVSVALGLLLAELNKGLFHNKIITFSESPHFFTIDGNTLRDKIKSILKSTIGLNTNFLKIADLFINNSITCKKLICFTDMQFDEGQSHNLFIQKFKDNNIEVPQLIYWNLTGNYNNYPINNEKENTSIISGYSEQLLTVILQNLNKHKLTYDLLMEKVLEPYYNSIVL
jgi:hypothetical protein